MAWATEEDYMKLRALAARLSKQVTSLKKSLDTKNTRIEKLLSEKAALSTKLKTLQENQEEKIDADA